MRRRKVNAGVLVHTQTAFETLYFVGFVCCCRRQSLSPSSPSSSSLSVCSSASKNHSGDAFMKLDPNSKIMKWNNSNDICYTLCFILRVWMMRCAATRCGACMHGENERQHLQQTIQVPVKPVSLMCVSLCAHKYSYAANRPIHTASYTWNTWPFAF